MNATEELRRLLEERGTVADISDNDNAVYWFCGRAEYEQYPDGSTRLIVYDAIPEDAIAATIGRETCRMTLCSAGNDYARFRCSECEQETMTPRVVVEGVPCGYERPSYCVNCGRQVVE